MDLYTVTLNLSDGRSITSRPMTLESTKKYGMECWTPGFVNSVRIKAVA